MRFRELVNFNEQSNMVTTIANVLQKGKETGQTLQAQSKPQSNAPKKQPVTTGTVGTQGSSSISKPATEPDQEKSTPTIQKPINIPTGTRIEPVVSTNPNILKFKMDNAVFSLDTKDPQNTQLLQQLQSMGVKGQS